MENKDINELNKDQLDNVNGGYICQVSGDSILLHKLGIMDEEFGDFDVIGNWKQCSEKVDAAWKKVGVICNSMPTADNIYYYEGRIITCLEAHQIAKNKMIQGPKIGQPLTGQ